ncbi:uncharacterized protein LOC143764805 [Ranitomeya variabilis]|uniref:uncharacterized protein LOC143764805 n=1 Tax=Ranitomeya variabilis TaxID=490064 RepID=UPI004057AE9E
MAGAACDNPECLNDVTRRWRSCRDQYRCERQVSGRSGDAAPKKRKYLYFDRLNFLAPVMELRPTKSNLTERETASDSEVVIDPIGEGSEMAGPSGQAPSSNQSQPAAASSATQEANPEVEEGGQSSSPTLALDTSPQPTTRPNRGRRRRVASNPGTRRQVDTGVLDYLSRAAHDDGEEAYFRSLARYLRPIPRSLRLRTRGCLQIFIDAATPPNNPTHVFNYLERWQMSPTNVLAVQDLPQEPNQTVAAPPLPRIAPQQQPAQNIQQQQNRPINEYPANAQSDHLNRHMFGGWSQHVSARHGHIGGYDQMGQYSTQDFMPFYPQHPVLPHTQDRNLQQHPSYISAIPQVDSLVGPPPRPSSAHAGHPPSPSPPPTYQNL